MPAPKTHQTSVIAMPDDQLWEPIQAIRREHDRQIHRWMPHVNLLYPFYPRDLFQTERVIPRLEAACQQVAAFDVRLATFRYFTHGAKRATIWLDPEPKDAFTHLQATLQQAFPEYDEQSRHRGGFTPHPQRGTGDLAPRPTGLARGVAGQLGAAHLPFRRRGAHLAHGRQPVPGRTPHSPGAQRTDVDVRL